MGNTYGDDEEQQEEVSGRTVVCACVAGTSMGGPLFGMMGFSLLASVRPVLSADGDIQSSAVLCRSCFDGGHGSHWLVYVRLDFSATQVKKANWVWCG